MGKKKTMEKQIRVIPGRVIYTYKKTHVFCCSLQSRHVILLVSKDFMQ